MIVSSVLFWLSVAAPIYTYALYPLALMLTKPKVFDEQTNYKPGVSIIVVSEKVECDSTIGKIESITHQAHSGSLECLAASDNASVQMAIENAAGDVIVVTDASTTLAENAVALLVARLSCSTVGCVCGPTSPTRTTWPRSRISCSPLSVPACA